MSKLVLLDNVPTALKSVALEHIADGYKMLSYENQVLVLKKRNRLSLWKLIFFTLIGLYGIAPLLIYQDFIGAKYYVYIQLKDGEVLLSTG